MRLLKRGLMVAILSVAGVLAVASSASAALHAPVGTPVNVGDTIWGGGSITSSGLGASTCSNVTLSGPVTQIPSPLTGGEGGRGQITALSSNNSCSGAITGLALTPNPPAGSNLLDVHNCSATAPAAGSTCNATVTNLRIRATTIFGVCDYSITAGGTYTNPGNLTFSGTANLVSTVSGFCSPTATLSGNFTVRKTNSAGALVSAS